jgi:hypothetical protein
MLQQWKKTLPILIHILHTVRNPRFTRHHFSSPLLPVDFHALLCRCKPGAADGLKGQPLVCKVDMRLNYKEMTTWLKGQQKRRNSYSNNSKLLLAGLRAQLCAVQIVVEIVR